MQFRCYLGAIIDDDKVGVKADILTVSLLFSGVGGWLVGKKRE